MRDDSFAINDCIFCIFYKFEQEINILEEAVDPDYPWLTGVDA